MILKSIIPSNIWTSIQSYVSTAAAAILPSQTSNSGKYLTTNGTSVSWANLIDIASVASGVSSATLNASSGVLTFSGTISSQSISYFTLSNNTISVDSAVIWSIDYTSSSNGIPIQASVEVSDDQIKFGVYNADPSLSTNANIVIYFFKAG